MSFFLKNKWIFIVTFMIALGAAASFTTQWVLVLFYSKEDFGFFSGVFGATQIGLQITVFGTHHFLLSRSKSGSHRLWMHQCSLLYVALAAFFAIMAFIFCCFFGLFSNKYLIFWFWMAFSVPSVLAYVFFQIEENKTAIAYWPFAQLLLRLFMVYIAALIGVPIEYQSVFFAASAFIFFIYTFFLYKDFLSKHFSKASNISWYRLKLLIKSSFPYFTHEFFEKADLRVALPMSVALLGGSVAADVAITISVLLAILLVPQSLFQRYFLARMHQWARTDYHRLSKFVFRCVLLLLFFSLALVFFISPFLEWGIVVVFGESYRSSIDLLQVTLFVPAFLLSSNALCNLFLSNERILVLQKIQIIWFLIFMLMMVLLTTKFGALGVCYALLFGRLIYLIFILMNLYDFSKLASIENQL